MTIRKAHVSLNVRDIAASIDFYRKTFGVEPMKQRPRYAKFDLVSPPLNLTMNEAAPTGVNASHFGIQVDTSQDVLDAKHRLEAAGLATHSQDSVSCCYAIQDKVWVSDPDGNAWEFFVVKADVEEVSASTTACCAR